MMNQAPPSRAEELRETIENLTRMQRRHEQYGDVILSIVGGAYAYSLPRRGLASIDGYKEVEIALLSARPDADGERHFLHPDQLELGEFSPLFNAQGIAPYVRWEDVNRIRAALAAKRGGGAPS